MRRLPRRRTTVLLAVAMAGVLVSCARGDDYYHRDPYENDRVLDSGLRSAQDEFAHALSAHDNTTILLRLTAPPFRDRMVRFLAGHGGRAARTTSRAPGDDATAEQDLSIGCAPGRPQRVDISWAWFDGRWRAWPDYVVADDGRTSEYPAC